MRSKNWLVSLKCSSTSRVPGPARPRSRLRAAYGDVHPVGLSRRCDRCIRMLVFEEALDHRRLLGVHDALTSSAMTRASLSKMIALNTFGQLSGQLRIVHVAGEPANEEEHRPEQALQLRILQSVERLAFRPATDARGRRAALARHGVWSLNCPACISIIPPGGR